MQAKFVNERYEDTIWIKNLADYLINILSYKTVKDYIFKDKEEIIKAGDYFGARDVYHKIKIPFQRFPKMGKNFELNMGFDTLNGYKAPEKGNNDLPIIVLRANPFEALGFYDLGYNNDSKNNWIDLKKDIKNMSKEAVISKYTKKLVNYLKHRGEYRSISNILIHEVQHMYDDLRSKDMMSLIKYDINADDLSASFTSYFRSKPEFDAYIANISTDILDNIVPENWNSFYKSVMYELDKLGMLEVLTPKLRKQLIKELALIWDKSKKRNIAINKAMKNDKGPKSMGFNSNSEEPDWFNDANKNKIKRKLARIWDKKHNKES